MICKTCQDAAGSGLLAAAGGRAAAGRGRGRAWTLVRCAAAALARVAFSVWRYRSPMPLVSYNALFVPMFAMGGLLCLVMSALFRQAAEMKAENDLTI